MLRILFVFFLIISCQQKDGNHSKNSIAIIPQPQEIEIIDTHFSLDQNTTLFYEKEFETAGAFLKKYIKKGAGFELQATGKDYAHIVISKVDSLPAEGYSLEVAKNTISIKSSDANGAFWGVQSLRQLMPHTFETDTQIITDSYSIPAVTIKDAPQFSYRGMHLDVGRHFFDKEFIKEYIAHLSMLKMNYFHWHLTEDQGWRIEIKQYPDLTNKGAYREETLLGHYSDHPQEFDGKRYGGYYTQEDVKEVVAFAATQNVTIIPEIEMPGHAQAAISAYPELGCTGKEVPVATKWGVFEDIYCPKPETFTFLKNVLAEVMELFPGTYIHIGGDEAPKAHWKHCGNCQQLISDLGLKDEHELQSHFIKEIETYVNSKGKKIIGWDEILEGGLAPNATVMSWRGIEGAVQAANEGHDVILTPTSHAYFDYYQAEHEDEPLAIGGFLPLQKIYNFDPIPEGIPSNKQHHVLGAQGNVWTEYMPTTDQVEYMAFPRMLAMSEVVWKGPSTHPDADYPNFLAKVESFLPRMDALDINYANHLYDLSGTLAKNKEGLYYALHSTIPGQDIRFRVDSTATFQQYTTPLAITQNTTIEGVVYKNDQPIGRPFSETIQLHKGVKGTIAISKTPHPSYSAGGKEALINGISGSDSRYGDSEWLGFWGENLEITIEFPVPTKVSSVSTRFYNAPGQWIYMPKEMRVDLYLENGVKMINGTNITPKTESNVQRAAIKYHEKQETIVTKLTIKIPNYGTIPEGVQGAGNKAWTFIDEIIIE